MYLNDANGNRVNCKSIQGTIEKWTDDSIDCDLAKATSVRGVTLTATHMGSILNFAVRASA